MYQHQTEGLPSLLEKKVNPHQFMEIRVHAYSKLISRKAMSTSSFYDRSQAEIMCKHWKKPKTSWTIYSLTHIKYNLPHMWQNFNPINHLRTQRMAVKASYPQPLPLILKMILFTSDVSVHNFLRSISTNTCWHISPKCLHPLKFALN